MKVLHNLDNSHYGGIQEMILSLHKHSRHQHAFWAYDGTMAPEMRAAGMTLYPGGPDRWEDYQVLVGHGVGGWSYDGGFANALSKGLKTIEVIHSNARSQTNPELVSAFVGLSPIVDRQNQHMPNRRVIHGPVDAKSFYRRPDANQIGRLSRLVEDKNPRPFVDLAKYFPEEEFVLAGGKIAAGESEDYYNAIARQASSNLKMVGYVRDFPEFYSHLKLYVYHTRDECCSMSVNMAMAAGVPVICHDIGPLRESTGGLARFCQDGQFKDALLDFLSDPIPFEETAIRGKGWAADHCGKSVSDWDDLVESLF